MVILDALIFKLTLDEIQLFYISRPALAGGHAAAFAAAEMRGVMNRHIMSPSVVFALLKATLCFV